MFDNIKKAFNDMYGSGSSLNTFGKIAITPLVVILSALGFCVYLFVWCIESNQNKDTK